MEDLNYLKKNYDYIAGCDEVGRGPLAGPVVAGCFYLELKKLTPKMIKMLFFELEKLGVDDSKKLTNAKRNYILDSLGIKLENLEPEQKYSFTNQKFTGLSYSIKEIQHDEIDKINILQASLKAMAKAFLLLQKKDYKGVLLIDGNKRCNIKQKGIDETPLIKGDQRSILIALASIVAKQYRDQLMELYAKKYPVYGFESHAGYPTKKHKEAIVKNGISPIHRKTFKGVKEFVTN
jgi:ribonuclease HII